MGGSKVNFNLPSIVKLRHDTSNGHLSSKPSEVKIKHRESNANFNKRKNSVPIPKQKSPRIKDSTKLKQKRGFRPKANSVVP